jgi:hypothetical protein
MDAVTAATQAIINPPPAAAPGVNMPQILSQIFSGKR